MATTEEALPATENIAVTTVTVTEPASTTTTSTPKNNILVYKVNRKIDKNDPDRFKNEGISFNAKLIGIEEVSDARGDKMCQEKIHKLKADVKASGLHKQRIIINVSEEGIKIVDVRHGVVEHSHPVHKVSFISRDMSDSRAFGYIFSTEDKKHQFYAIKTEKASEAVVLTLRDLFQIIFERKKKEMEEAKKQQETVETTEEKQDPNVIKLDGELNTESNTDEDPVYSVPQNNQPVKDRAGSSLVDLENELETIGQGIEQMNKLETFFESEDVPSSAPSNDPWGASTTTGSKPEGSSSSDLQDIDLFGTKPASPVDKNAILGLFGNQPTMPPGNPGMLHAGYGAQPGFGQPQPGFGAQPQPGFGAQPQPGFGAQPQPGFGAQPQPGFGAQPQPGFAPQPQGFPGQPQPGMGGQPAFGAPAANPFGGQPMPGTPAPFAANPMGGFAPGVPPRTGMGVAPPASNPFGGAAQPPLGSAFPAVSNDPFGEPLLAPLKMTPDEQGRDSPKPPADAFGDLCDIGGKKSTDKTPKQLFAEKNSSNKKPINQMISETSPPIPQASSEDPFGIIDTTALPALSDSKSLDPFDTSFINNPLKAMQPIPACKSDIPTQLPMMITEEDSENENFNMPSPEGPPPPLPPERKIDKINSIPPAPPPRPSPLHSCDNPNLPELPPRNAPPESQKTSIKPVPRPRPQSRGLSGKRASTESLSNTFNENTSVKPEENNNLNFSPSNSDKLSMNSSDSSNHSSRFVIEDPFENNDPFADCDPFNSSSGFSSAFDKNGTDPFASTFTSQFKTPKNGLIDSADDPFAVFDKSISDPFSFKTSSVQKNTKVKTDNSKQPPSANDPFDTFFN